MRIRPGFPIWVILQAGVAHADCQQQLQVLAADLRGVPLTEMQRQSLGGIVDAPRRYCWVHREDAAMGYIAKARNVAGLHPFKPDNEWETMPLESLEKTPSLTR